MKTFFRFLRPMAFARRKAIYAGVLGGSRKWLVFGGAAWVFHWMGSLFGVGEAKPRYTQEVSAGERIVVVHEPLSPLAVKKARKKAAREERKAAKKSAR